MQRTKIRFEADFEVVAGNARSQAAVMTLEGGESTGGAENRHRGADQWLYVVGGRGWAVVAGQQIRLEPGTLLLIEMGEAHEIRSDEGARLETLDFYVPPAYTGDGETLPTGEG